MGRGGERRGEERGEERRGEERGEGRRGKRRGEEERREERRGERTASKALPTAKSWSAAATHLAPASGPTASALYTVTNTTEPRSSCTRNCAEVSTTGGDTTVPRWPGPGECRSPQDVNKGDVNSFVNSRS